MKKKYMLLVVLVGLIALSYMSKLGDNTIVDMDSVNDEYSDFGILRSSGYWELTANITIDDSATGLDAQNWTWAVSQAWCSGTGSYDDPFLIENVSITVDSDTYGIIIENSNTTTYFKINNVTIINTDASGSGILLNNTYHGQLIDCNCSGMADSGVKALNSINMTIDDGIMSNNDYGLYLDNITVSTISGNSIINNTNTGLYGINCTYNSIEATNDLTDNDDYGIYLHDSDNNNITSNYIRSGNDTGICLIDSDSCIIYSNTISGNTGTGLLLNEDDGNSLTNTVYYNTFSSNGVNGNDSCSAANSWDNGVYGNSWDNYWYYDGNDDGIGDVAWDIPGSADATDRYPLYDDGAEPTVTLDLDDDDDADEMLEGIGGSDSQTYNIWLIVAISGGIAAAMVMLFYFLYLKKRVNIRHIKKIR